MLTGGFLDAQRQMIGPFCQWSIRIPREYNSELDLSGLRSIIIEFEGTLSVVRVMRTVIDPWG